MPRIVARARFAAAAAAAALVSACALPPVTPDLQRYDPGAGYRWQNHSGAPGNDPGTLLVLTFSGGGTRAAAFAYGVLEELRRTQARTPDGREGPLLRQVDLITGTSGGSFTALAYALYGESLFGFYDGSFLKRNVEGELIERLFDPLRWPQVLSQGVGRSELAEEYYDEILFRRATFADLAGLRTPFAVVGATDVSTGARIDFTQAILDAMCVDLGKLRLSRAATASSAVPLLFSPVTLRNRGGSCGYAPPAWLADALAQPREATLGNRAIERLRQNELLADGARRPWIHMVDGGLSDNMALYSVVETLQEMMDNPAYRADLRENGLRRVAIVIVNARSALSFGFDQVPVAPGPVELLVQSISVPMDRYSSESVAALRDVVNEWRLRQRLQADARRLGRPVPAADELPAVDFSIVEVSFDAVADPQLRAYLQGLPTSFALPEEAVDRLRETAATLLRESPAFRKFSESLNSPP